MDDKTRDRVIITMLVVTILLLFSTIWMCISYIRSPDLKIYTVDSSQIPTREFTVIIPAEGEGDMTIIPEYPFLVDASVHEPSRM